MTRSYSRADRARARWRRGLGCAVAALGVALAGFPAAGEAPLHLVRSRSVGDGFGHSARSAGDVNGDGGPDFIVGAPFDSERGFHAGAARVFSGVDGSVLHSFYGVSPNDEFGCAVAGVGDVSGDGYGDLLVGARYSDDGGANSGSARVFSGRDGSLLHHLPGRSAYALFGSSVSAAGDVDGDGRPDYIVGAPRSSANGDAAGLVRVYSGADASVLHRFLGDRSGDGLGHAVAGAGDVNGDGLADLLVGAPGADPHGSASGSAQVFSGRDGSVLLAIAGDSPTDNLGFSVAGVGDLNGDGVPDLLIGAPRDDPGAADAGSAFVHSGADGTQLLSLRGSAGGDFFGCAVAAAGDLDGDGVDDLLVGACLADGAGSNSGAAAAFSGANAQPLCQWVGFDELDEFGTAVASLGDVDGDGRPDILVSAPSPRGRGTRVGRVLILSSASACSKE